MPRDYGELECPVCGGMGCYESGLEYKDEDGNWYDTHLVRCPMCLGTGGISGEATVRAMTCHSQLNSPQENPGVSRWSGCFELF